MFEIITKRTKYLNMQMLLYFRPKFKKKKWIHDYQMPGPFLSQLPAWLVMIYVFPGVSVKWLRLPLDTCVWRHIQVLFVCFCCFTSHVNSYGHCRTVSSLNHTFSWAGLSKRLTSNLCAYFRLLTDNNPS